MRFLSLVAMLALAGAVVPAVAGAQPGTVISAVPASPLKAMLERAMGWQQAGQFGKAVEDYTAALEDGSLIGKARAVAFYNRGLSRQAMGDAAGAVSDFSRALYEDKQFAQGYLARANALLSGGRADLALVDFRRAIELKHPEPQLAMLGEARALAALGQKASAQASLERALVLAPGLMQARTELKDMLREEGLDAFNLGEMPEDLAQVEAGIETAGLVGKLVERLPQGEGRDPELPGFMRLPSNMLDAAAMVDHSAIRLSTLQTIVLSQTPSLGGPGMVVTEVLSRPKVQDRVAEASESVLPLPKFIRVEAASSGPETQKKEMRIPQAEAPKPVLSPFVVLGGAASDEDDAWKLWDKLKSAEAELLDGKDAEVVRVKGKGKALYRLQVNGVDSAKAGAKLCGALKAQLGFCEVARRG